MFQVSADGTSVRVDWEVANETGVSAFDLYRRNGNDPVFERITSIAPTGQRRYQYIDADLYRGTGATSGSGGPYTYRLTIRTTGADQSYTTTLSQTPSAVQRSWGSIKSMFR
jgi:hypothetical protein